MQEVQQQFELRDAGRRGLIHHDVEEAFLPLSIDRVCAFRDLEQQPRIQAEEPLVLHVHGRTAEPLEVRQDVARTEESLIRGEVRRTHPAGRSRGLGGLPDRDAGCDREIDPAERIAIVDEETGRVPGDDHAIRDEAGHHPGPELRDEMGAVLRDLAPSDEPLDGGMHPELRLQLLDFDLLARQVLRGDDEAQRDGRLVRVQESASSEAHRCLSREHVRGAVLLAESEALLDRLR